LPAFESSNRWLGDFPSLERQLFRHAGFQNLLTGGYQPGFAGGPGNYIQHSAWSGFFGSPSAKMRSSRAYEIDLLFCNKGFIYHQVEIVGLNSPIDEFKNVAEKVFNSLKID
jgi:hypothetical protein